MHKPYIISYDLSEKNQNKYDEIFKTIENFGAYCKIQKSVWLVKTTLTPTQMYDRIVASIGSDDYIFISEVSSNYYGWAQKDHWTFIKEHIY